MWFLHTVIVLSLLSLPALSTAATLENQSPVYWKHYKHTTYRGNVRWINQPFPAKYFPIDNPRLLQNDLSVSSRQPPSRQSKGLTFDPCSGNSDCAGERICFALISASPVLVEQCPPVFSGSNICLCLPANPSDLPCTRDKQCEKGEICEEIPSVFEGSVCLSKAFGGDGDGLTGDECSTNSDCKLPRRCRTLGKDPFVTGCFPVATISCFDDSECDDGEVCIRDFNIADFPLCVSEDANFRTPRPTASPVAPSPSSTPIQSPASSSTSTPTPSSEESASSPIPSSSSSSSSSPSPAEDPGSVGGLTLDPCQATSNCQGSRECRDMNSGNACTGGDCRCLTFIPCDTDDDCSNGERCMNPDELGFPISNGAQLCVSRAAERAVCIGAHSLKHLSREELVFKHDALANVLCDMNDSCATPGHMVVYKGRALMMKNYCKMTECVRKVLRVNSPKYSRGLTIPSQTGDLLFTAFAARFETLAEEGMLSVAVRLGL